MRETQRDELLRIRDVLARVHVSRATFYRLVRRGEAPAPIHLGRTALWSSVAVDAWIADLTKVAA